MVRASERARRKPSKRVGTKASPVVKEVKPAKGDYRAYVGFQPLPKNETVKIESLVITDAQGNLVQKLEDVSPIGDLVGTASDRKIRLLLQKHILELFDITVKTANIKLLPFEEVDDMLFKRADP